MIALKLLKDFVKQGFIKYTNKPDKRSQILIGLSYNSRARFVNKRLYTTCTNRGVSSIRIKQLYNPFRQLNSFRSIRFYVTLKALLHIKKCSKAIFSIVK